MQTELKEIETWLRCVAIKNIKYPHRLYLINALQQQPEINSDTLRQFGLTDSQISQYSGFPVHEITRAQQWMAGKGQHFIHYHHPYYPQSLKQCASPPLYLFAVGNIALLDKVQLAIVGSRHCTYYGN